MVIACGLPDGVSNHSLKRERFALKKGINMEIKHKVKTNTAVLNQRVSQLKINKVYDPTATLLVKVMS